MGDKLRKHRRLLRVTIVLVLLVLFSSACGPRRFEGHLIVNIGDSIYDISIDSDAETAERVRIAGPDVDLAVLSPDHQFLLYSMEGETRLYDFQTREAKTLFPRRAVCASWAWDSSKFSYNDWGALKIYDLSNNTSTLVIRAPSATYDVIGEVRDRQLFGRLECGTWIGDDRFVFQRYVGAMPGAIFTIDSGLMSNMSALAVFDGDVTLQDADQLFYVRDISADQSSFMLYFPGDESADSMYLSQPFIDLKNIGGRKIPISLHRPPLPNPDLESLDVGFMPNSGEVYYHFALENNIYFINPETLEDRKGPVWSSDLNFWSFDPHSGGNWIWVGDSKDHMIAIMESENPTHSQEYGWVDLCCNIWLIDLDSDKRTLIVEEIQLDFSVSARTKILAWFPK